MGYIQIAKQINFSPKETITAFDENDAILNETVVMPEFYTTTPSLGYNNSSYKPSISSDNRYANGFTSYAFYKNSMASLGVTSSTSTAEIKVAFKLTENPSNNSTYYINHIGYLLGYIIKYDSTNDIIYLAFRNWDGTGDINVTSYPLSLDTWYYVKESIDSSFNKTKSISTDNENFQTLDSRLDNANNWTTISGEYCSIGNKDDGNYPFSIGIIDLANTYLKLDNIYCLQTVKTQDYTNLLGGV